MVSQDGSRQFCLPKTAWDLRLSDATALGRQRTGSTAKSKQSIVCRFGDVCRH